MGIFSSHNYFLIVYNGFISWLSVFTIICFRCEISYHTIEEPHYKQECQVNVKHFCSKKVEPYGLQPIPDHVNNQQDKIRDYHYQTSFSSPHQQYPIPLPEADPFHGRFEEQPHRVKRDHHSPRHPVDFPIQSSYEVPSPPGCRSIATKNCHQIPIVVAKKVPYSECFPVPTLDCGLVLRSVPELDCTPLIKEECKKEANDIPFIVNEEQCEQVVYDECQEVGSMTLVRIIH